MTLAEMSLEDRWFLDRENRIILLRRRSEETKEEAVGTHKTEDESLNRIQK